MDNKNVDLVKGGYAVYIDECDYYNYLFDGTKIIQIYTYNPNRYRLYSFCKEFAVLENNIPLYYWYHKNEFASINFVMFNQYNFINQTISNLKIDENNIANTHFKYRGEVYHLVYILKFIPNTMYYIGLLPGKKYWNDNGDIGYYKEERNYCKYEIENYLDDK